MVLRTNSKFADSLRFLTCSIAVTTAGVSLCAQEGFEPTPEGISPTILNRSPFIPPDWEPPQNRRAKAVPKNSSTGYEFRGVYQLGNEYRFLVSAPRTHNGKWVTVGTEHEDYEVRGYDPASETLTLYYDSKEEELTLAKMDANPTPMAVSGQVRQTAAKAATGQRPARRTIRPSSRTTSSPESGSSAPPPPAWLKKLREEAAERRAQAGGPGRVPGGGPPSDISSSGNPGSANAPPDYTPPSPPQELLDMDIPPPPTSLPPTPPPDVLQKIQDSLYNRNPGS